MKVLYFLGGQILGEACPVLLSHRVQLRGIVDEPFVLMLLVAAVLFFVGSRNVRRV